MSPPAWSDSHRKVIIVLLGGMFAYLVVRLWLNPVHVPDPQPPVSARAAEVEDRIDPNKVEWHILAALPVIGEKRARDIVDYREQFAANNPGRAAFAKAEDLLEIRGIGLATLSQIEPYLIFPPTSQPAATQP